MKSRFASFVAIALALGLIPGSTFNVKAGAGGFGGNGAFSNGGFSDGGGRGSGGVSGGGSFSHSSSSGGGNFSHGSGGMGFSRSSGGFVAPPSSQPARSGSNFVGGRSASTFVNPPEPARHSYGSGFVEFPSGNRSAVVVNRAESLPTQFPVHPGAGISGVPRAGIPSVQRSPLPGRGEVENFLGVKGGTAAGNTVANAPAQLSTNRTPAALSPAESSLRPEQRSDWAVRSQNRSPQWQQRVAARHDAWTNWEQKNQDQLNAFALTRDQRWAGLQTAQQDPRNWRDPSGQAWRQHRRDQWGFRVDRANEIRSRARDFSDGFFDDRWWGRCPWAYGYGYYGFGHYPVNPWWWWLPAGWADVSGFVDGCPPNPVYADYGGNIIYDGDTAYVDGQPMSEEQYTGPMADLAVNAAQPPPPTPPAEGQTAEWLPLGVFALAQEEKGDPILFLQLSVSRQGAISGAYTSTLTEDQRPVAGLVDKATQRVVWRIGANTDTIFETTLANLTQDVSPVAVHFGNSHTQTWLLVRMPPPAPAGSSEAIPEISPAPPALPSPAAPPP